MRSRAALAWAIGLLLTVEGGCSSDDASRSLSNAAAGEAGASSGGEAGDSGGGDHPTHGGMAAAGAPASGEEAGAGGMGGARPELTTEGWLSGTRLRAVLKTSGSARLFETWYDEELEIECRFALDAEGLERCLPDAPFAYAAYADADCTQPIALFYDRVEPSRYLAEEQPLVCGKGTRYREVGEEVEVSQLFSNASGECEATSIVDSSQRAMKLGDFVAEDLFVASLEVLQEERDERLVANVRVAEDGSREVVSHFDLEREVECEPRQHQAEAFACVPKHRGYLSGHFADTDCEVPVAYRSGYAQATCGRQPDIAQASAPNFADTYYEIGEEVTDSVYQHDGQSCRVYEPPASLRATFYAVGEPLPWSAFPRLESHYAGTGRIAVQVLSGAGGLAISREAFFDTQLSTLCVAGEAADLETRCLPQTLHTVNLYADASCTEALFQQPEDEALPVNLKYLRGDTRGGGTAVFEIADQVPPPEEMWRIQGTECEPSGIVAGYDHYATTSVSPAAFAEITRVVE